MRTWILMCGGRKRPQNSKVGAESAPKMSMWGQKAPPQFGHDKNRIEFSIKVGAESAPKITKWGQKAPPKQQSGGKKRPHFHKQRVLGRFSP